MLLKGIVYLVQVVVSVGSTPKSFGQDAQMLPVGSVLRSGTLRDLPGDLVRNPRTKSCCESFLRNLLSYARLSVAGAGVTGL